MKILATLITAIFLISAVSHADEQQVKIAKVDYSEIKELLEAVVLARPENKELATRHKAQEAKNNAAQEKMQKAIMNGEKINPMEAASGMMHRSEDRNKVEMLCDKLALEIIEKIIADKYQIVLKSQSSHRHGLLR